MLLLSQLFNETQVKIRDSILRYIPKEAEITRIEFEGPRIAIYTRKPEILIDQSYIIKDIVGLIRKRLVVRSDPSVRLSEPKTEKLVHKKVPLEAEITGINFDPTIGEVIIEAKKPGLVIGKEGVILQEMTRETRWRPRVLRTPPISSKIIANVRHYMRSESKERERILRAVGERIFRPQIFDSGEILLTPLGGFQQVGRSAILVRTKESMVLLDCGINPGAKKPSDIFPRLGVTDLDFDLLDAVVISHAHLDHCGALPLLYKYGYDGPVYCSEPTLNLMTLLQLDYLDVTSKEGRYLPFSQKDVRETVLHTIPLELGVVTDITPDMRLTLHNAGHILGSSIIHIHIGEGEHNLVYTGDFKYGRTMLLEPATTNFPRVETLITESTYGARRDQMPNRKLVEGKLVTVVNETLEKNGKALFPVLAVGRAQEVMLILDTYMKQGLLKEVPVFIEGMISEVTAIHTAYPDYLSREIRDQILHRDLNPFESEFFTIVQTPSTRQEALEGGPCVILATSGMLEGGPVIEYFKQMARDSRNTLVFVSYQIEGTLGRRIQRGLGEIPIMGENNRLGMVKVGMRVESVEGLSGHSDSNQIINYVRRISPKPERIVVCHGERSKCLGLASTLHRVNRINSSAPNILESLRLK